MKYFWAKLGNLGRLENRRLFLHILFVAFISSAPAFFFVLPIHSIIIEYRRYFLPFFLLSIYWINVRYFTRFFLNKQTSWIYTLFFISTLLISVLINQVSIQLLVYLYKQDAHILTKFISGIFGTEPLPENLRILMPMRNYAIIFPTAFVLTAGISIEAFFHQIDQEQRQKDIEREKIMAELSFLKSQVSPHFLFNTLTNIHALATEKSDDTQEIILKLSQLMRYMLYESDVESILLQKEIECLEDYIELQRMRLSKSRNIQISFQVEGEPRRISIEPMLLIPFVENAFKYGVSYRKKSLIEVNMNIWPGQIHFRVFNYKLNIRSKDLENNHGIGLQNVQRRLKLLYPDRHQLSIQETPETYEIHLTIFPYV